MPPPHHFFERLAAFGVGLPGQRVLDLGAGSGEIARSLARRRALVTAIDASAEWIEVAGFSPRRNDSRSSWSSAQRKILNCRATVSTS